MQRKVYRTKLRPEHREEYIEAHRNISSDLMRRYRDAGIAVCAVYILGDDIVLLTEAEDHSRTQAILARDTLDQEWQSFLRPMKIEGDWQEMDELFFACLTKDS